MRKCFKVFEFVDIVGILTNIVLLVLYLTLLYVNLDRHLKKYNIILIYVQVIIICQLLYWLHFEFHFEPHAVLINT
jgi:hypothetical protein